MSRSVALSLLMIVVCCGTAGAGIVQGNRGVACTERDDAVSLKTHAGGDQKRWADLTQRLAKDGRCRTLFDGTKVDVIQRDDSGVALVEVRDGPRLWVDEDALIAPRSLSNSVSYRPPRGDVAPHVALGLMAAIVAVAALIWVFGRSGQQIAHVAAAVDGSGVEIWEERRLPRSVFGRLVMLAFLAFNGWMLFELAALATKLNEVRGAYRDSGFAQLGISLVANARINEIFAVWMIGAVLLGLAVLGTRGKKQMVRKRAPLQK